MNIERIKTEMLTRIAALGVNVSENDAELLDYMARRAASKVAGICGFDIASFSPCDENESAAELLSAAADIGGADLAAAVLSRGDGAVSARSDGDVSVRYAAKSSGGELRAEEASRMRECGIAAAMRHRRIRW